MYIWWREILAPIFLVTVISSTMTKNVMNERFSCVFCETVTILYFLMMFSHEFHIDRDQRL